MTVGDLLQLARAQDVMIATAESCTGGLLAGALTDIPGSSDVFDRGFVTYSNAAKSELLGIDPTLIENHGAVSPQVARAMAEGALARSRAGLAVSITGVAGPGGTPHKPEGMVCFCLAKATPDGVFVQNTTHEFGAVGRQNVRAQAVTFALQMLFDALS